VEAGGHTHKYEKFMMMMMMMMKNRDSLAAGWKIGFLGFDSRGGLGIFLFTIAFRTALGPTQPPIQWVLGALSLGVKRPVNEPDHSPPSSAKVKELM
jgi:hypothetical protein